MGRLNKLTQKHIDNARPATKPFNLADGGGLVLQVQPSGGLWWRLRYRFAGKQMMLSLGTYPDTSLKMARDKRDDARRLLAAEPPIDPSIVRKAERQAATSPETLKAIATEFLEMQTAGAAATTLRRLELHVFPYLGKKPIARITAAELLAVLRRVEHKGAHDTAHRIRSACSRIWRYAVGSGRAEQDIAAALAGQLAPVNAKNFATITEPKRIGELLRAIDGYSGLHSVCAALKLAPLVFVRPGELRAATWDEFDLEEAEWRIPAHRTKLRAEHVVPLADQAVAILDDLFPLTGSESGYVFPSVRSRSACMSDNSLNAALRRMGYSKEQMTAHGFRSMASTRLNELGFPPDVIEKQLAHAERNKVRAAYNHASYLPQRREMMQFWADYLDSLKTGADVVAIGSRSTRSA
jgi:integrase